MRPIKKEFRKLKESELEKSIDGYWVGKESKNEPGLITITNQSNPEVMFGYDFASPVTKDKGYFTSDENGNDKVFKSFEDALSYAKKTYSSFNPSPNAILFFKKLVSSLNESIITIQEDQRVGNIILEKGDRIQIIKEDIDSDTMKLKKIALKIKNKEGLDDKDSSFIQKMAKSAGLSVDVYKKGIQSLANSEYADMLGESITTIDESKLKEMNSVDFFKFKDAIIQDIEVHENLSGSSKYPVALDIWTNKGKVTIDASVDADDVNNIRSFLDLRFDYNLNESKKLKEAYQGFKTFKEFLEANFGTKIAKAVEKGNEGDGFDNLPIEEFMEESYHWGQDIAFKSLLVTMGKHPDWSNGVLTFMSPELKSLFQKKIYRMLKDFGMTRMGITIKESLKLKEALDWEDLLKLAKDEKLDPKVVGFLKFIDKNKEKYKADIDNFVAWANDEIDEADIDTLEKMIVKNPPEETGFEGLPSNDWKFYTAKATESVLKEFDNIINVICIESAEPLYKINDRGTAEKPSDENLWNVHINGISISMDSILFNQHFTILN